MDPLALVIAEFVSSVRHLAPKDAVSLRLFVNCESSEVTFAFRTPEELKQGGISMRNLAGEFIETKES